MSYNKFKFDSLKQFKEVQNLAEQNNLKTTKEFNEFLETNYSHLKK